MAKTSASKQGSVAKTGAKTVKSVSRTKTVKSTNKQPGSSTVPGMSELRQAILTLVKERNLTEPAVRDVLNQVKRGIEITGSARGTPFWIAFEFVAIVRRLLSSKELSVHVVATFKVELSKIRTNEGWMKAILSRIMTAL